MAPTHSRWLARAAVLLPLVTVLAIGIIASGVFDPSPAGTRRWRLEDKQILLSPQSRDIIWLEEQVPDSPITIRMTASHKSGEEDIGYGLLLGDEAAYLAVAVSPLGYLAIWESDVQSGGSTDSYLLEWQTWPHVKTEGSPNEIWVDIVGNQAGVRVNREWLWEGEITSGSGNVGLLGESFAETAVIDFESVELFAKRGE
jgi:hypothetical protein